MSLFSGLFVLLLAPEFFQPLRDLSQHYHDRAGALGAADHLRSRLEGIKPEDSDNRNASGNSAAIIDANNADTKKSDSAIPTSANKNHAVVVEDLAVSYPGRGISRSEERRVGREWRSEG